MTTTRGKYAYGFCDRTGFRYPLHELVDEFQNGVKTGLRGGRDVADGDHPQNFLGRIRIFDPQSLDHARPETRHGTNLGGIAAVVPTPEAKPSIPFNL